MSDTVVPQKYPFHPLDYHIYLQDLLDGSGVLKYVGGWWAFFTALIALFFNGLVLRLVVKRLKTQYNIDMMLVSVVLSIDLIYCTITIISQILLASTDYQIFNSNAYVQIFGFLQPFLILASLYMVAILSFERYMFTVKGIKWTPWSYYALAFGYISPPMILGLVGAGTSQFMPMPACMYSLVLIDQSSFAGIYIGFFTVQSIIAGLVFNTSYLFILLHHRKLLLNPLSDPLLDPKLKEPKSKPKTKNLNDEVLSLPAMLQQPVPPAFKLREHSRSLSLANTLLYKTLTIMLIYNCTCIPIILALAYELITLLPRSVVWDFISVITISNHALVSPLVVLFLHQPTNDDWNLYKDQVICIILNKLGIQHNYGQRMNQWNRHETFPSNRLDNMNNTLDMDSIEDFSVAHSRDIMLNRSNSSPSNVHLESTHHISVEEELVTYQA